MTLWTNTNPGCSFYSDFSAGKFFILITNGFGNLQPLFGVTSALSSNAEIRHLNLKLALNSESFVTSFVYERGLRNPTAFDPKKPATAIFLVAGPLAGVAVGAALVAGSFPVLLTFP